MSHNDDEFCCVKGSKRNVTNLTCRLASSEFQFVLSSGHLIRWALASCQVMLIGGITATLYGTNDGAKGFFFSIGVIGGLGVVTCVGMSMLRTGLLGPKEARCFGLLVLTAFIVTWAVYPLIFLATKNGWGYYDTDISSLAFGVADFFSKNVLMLLLHILRFRYIHHPKATWESIHESKAVQTEEIPIPKLPDHAVLITPPLLAPASASPRPLPSVPSLKSGIEEMLEQQQHEEEEVRDEAQDMFEATSDPTNAEEVEASICREMVESLKLRFTKQHTRLGAAFQWPTSWAELFLEHERKEWHARLAAAPRKTTQFQSGQQAGLGAAPLGHNTNALRTPSVKGYAPELPVHDRLYVHAMVRNTNMRLEDLMKQARELADQGFRGPAPASPTLMSGMIGGLNVTPTKLSPVVDDRPRTERGTTHSVQATRQLPPDPIHNKPILIGERESGALTDRSTGARNPPSSLQVSRVLPAGRSFQAIHVVSAPGRTLQPGEVEPR
jgi:hypothetical protein